MLAIDPEAGILCNENVIDCDDNEKFALFRLVSAPTSKPSKSPLDNRQRGPMQLSISVQKCALSTVRCKRTIALFVF